VMHLHSAGHAKNTQINATEMQRPVLMWVGCCMLRSGASCDNQCTSAVCRCKVGR
jgi:hypothetical protein